MDGPFYVRILQTQLLPAAQRMYGGGNWCLQQDNDPKHTSCVAKEFIAENSIHLIDWPSNSPDINPIENKWQITKNNVEEWDAIPQEMVNNLVSSMQNRCEAILLHDGNRISYY